MASASTSKRTPANGHPPVDYSSSDRAKLYSNSNRRYTTYEKAGNFLDLRKRSSTTYSTQQHAHRTTDVKAPMLRMTHSSDVRNRVLPVTMNDCGGFGRASSSICNLVPRLPGEYTADPTNSSPEKNLDEDDRTLLAELDRVKKQMFKSPATLLCSIRNVMTESKRERQSLKSAPALLNREETQTSTKYPAINSNHSSHTSSVCRPNTYSVHSNSSPVNPFSNSDLVNSTESDNHQSSSRQNSSSSSASLPPDGSKQTSMQHTSRSQTLTKFGSRKNGTVSSFQKPYSNGGPGLPMVYTEENLNCSNNAVSSLHMLPLGARQNKSQNNVMHTTTHRTSRNIDMADQISLLSISGIKHDGRSEEEIPSNGTPQQSLGRDRSEATLLSRIATTPSSMNRPPLSNSQSSQNSTNQQRKPFKTHSFKSSTAKSRLSEEPKYADPVAGSSMSFQNRLAELAALEAETVRWEARMKKVKKKPKED